MRISVLWLVAVNFIRFVVLRWPTQTMHSPSRMWSAVVFWCKIVIDRYLIISVIQKTGGGCGIVEVIAEMDLNRFLYLSLFLTSSLRKFCFNFVIPLKPFTFAQTDSHSPHESVAWRKRTDTHTERLILRKNYPGKSKSSIISLTLMIGKSKSVLWNVLQETTHGGRSRRTQSKSSVR